MRRRTDVRNRNEPRAGAKRPRADPSRAMADINVQQQPANAPVEDDYTTMEVVLWVIGIVLIPLVPILMVTFLTPWSGM